MTIRNAAKAIIINKNKVLLLKYDNPILGEYYTLPGGGQNQYETMVEAVKRECLEETGYSICIDKFVGICEIICLDEYIRVNHPNYAHKIYHIFRAYLKSENTVNPTEVDSLQIAMEWIDLEEIKNMKILPKCIGESFLELVQANNIIDLGSSLVRVNK
ncbi:NUDIX domain-containing protein [Miniphocaeibacter massiliensis]|uniref:NUDIX domain-containing protein n=1 Tax=Miniphocaeibacter massiliensis TaxID=2041841 RepID=UPI0013EB59DA|nr:NUDIX domain-containing protein [Miniphocaeibacter massiliensis]